MKYLQSKYLLIFVLLFFIGAVVTPPPADAKHRWWHGKKGKKGGKKGGGSTPPPTPPPPPTTPTPGPPPTTLSTLADFTSYPPFLTTAAPPLAMFVLSKNHKLFYKAYNDITDLDDDGVIDSTYKDTINYYGYFDSMKCYSYTSGVFKPTVVGTGVNGHYCSGTWSGNFLNWTTMSRMDLIRKVLYGGKRVTDTSTKTVIGRALLPQDAHSWVKTYSGSDISSLTPFSWSNITLCNTNTSRTQNSSLLYAINGYFPYAASTEGKQCRLEEPGGSSLSISATYNVDVEVCIISMLELNCTEYKTGSSASNYKPSGLMQTFGVERNGTADASDDKVKMKFGLMTGSYGANVSGGVLRSNIDDLRNSEVDNGNGIILGASKIIKNINNFKVLQYNYSTGWYNAGGAEGSCVPGEPAVLTNGLCTSWGNPVGEMLYETIRYFQAQVGPTSQFELSTTDPGLSSLSVENKWTDPYLSCPACSKAFAIILSDEYPSYDSDHLPGSYWPTSISTADTPSVQSLISTSKIDLLESIRSTFIGQSLSSFDRNCTAKPASFKSIRGLCVEEPTKQGAYYIAGLANYAKTTDLNPAPGTQDLTTYAISTGSVIPNLEFDVSGKKVVVVPIFHDGCPSASYPGCSSQGANGDNSKGAMVDFQICPNDADWTTEQSAGYTSCYDGMWDDAEYGWDYELDIRYRIYVKQGATTITLKTKGLAAAAGHEDFAGYAISGVSGAGDYYEIRCGGAAGFSDCDRYDRNETPNNTRTFAVTGTTSGFLKSPLWYAAKYGGFKDNDGSNTPNLTGEWDNDGDGVPDTYFDAANPLKLESELSKALTAVLNRSSSGTSVSVLATAGEGEGALYQAYFYPSKYEAGLERKWIGYMHGLFLDSFGNLREDTDQDGRLILTSDRIVRTFFDTTSGETKVNIFVDADGDGKADSTTPADTLPIDQMSPIWEAGKELAIAPSSSRKIFTWLNTNHDNTVDPGEFVLFDDTQKTALKPYIRALDDNANGSADDESANIINFIRGDQIAGMRDRDITVGGSKKIWKLGDIVYSTPATVSAPRERYDLLYGDTSYRAFYNQYKNRRNVVYVGANDGMLHAFNAGFYTPGDDPLTPKKEHGRFDPGAGKKLGQELWSFIPYQLLPHLKWLTRQDYTHVYYVDLKPKVTDAQIFTPDADHPNGWGTILIGGMRMGGGTISVTDTFSGGTPGTRTFESAYFVLDITNPEKDPVLLASFTDSDLGFTTSFPSVLRVTNGTSPPTTTKWMFMVGSGPTTYTGASGQNAKIKIVNLKTGVLERTIDTGLTNAFMGDSINIDGNLDFTTDVAYIGSSYLQLGEWKGNMYRLSIQNQLNPANWVLSTLYQTDPGPITAAPTASFGTNNKLWVYFGTGRYYDPTDQNDTSQQHFYGIKDPCWNDVTLLCTTTVTQGDLLKSSGFRIKTDGSSQGGPQGTFKDLLLDLNASTTNKGWYFDLAPKERVLSKSSVLGGIVFFTSFVPNGDACTAGGISFMHGLYYETGTSYPESPFGEPPPPPGAPPVEVKNVKTLGEGLPSGIGIHIGSATSGGGSGTCQSGIKGFVQQSTGTITEVCGDPAFSIRSGVKGWRDF
ncbi:MAG: pilus assembly protein [Nitrospiria bacterium]